MSSSGLQYTKETDFVGGAVASKTFLLQNVQSQSTINEKIPKTHLNDTFGNINEAGSEGKEKRVSKLLKQARARRKPKK